jgi:hypothetical protein
MTSKVDLQSKLEKKLQELENTTRLGLGLNVLWCPDGSGALSGEVKGDIIYVYEQDEEAALKTLKHEILDYAISQVIMPYMEVTNKLIILINEDAYRRKERLVEALNKIL